MSNSTSSRRQRDPNRRRNHRDNRSRERGERQYHDDNYTHQETPRTYEAPRVEEGYSNSSGEQSGYGNAPSYSPESNLPSAFDNLNVNDSSDSPYTTRPPYYSSETDYTSTYSQAAYAQTAGQTHAASGYPSSGQAVPYTYDVPPAAQVGPSSTSPYGSAYSSQAGPSSTAAYGAYSGQAGPPSTTPYGTAYLGQADPSSTALYGTAYSGGQPNSASTIYPPYPNPYTAASSAASYSQSPQSTYPADTTTQSAQPQVWPYPSSGAPIEPPSTYSSRQSSETPRPGTIAQCGCLGCDRDSKFAPKIGTDRRDHKKASSSSRSKHSSKRDDPSKTTFFDKVELASFNTQTGTANCGALYLSDIKPWGRPQEPPTGCSVGELEDYNDLLKEWREQSRKWRDISCICGYGYFRELDGHWVPGSHVRKYMKEGPNALGAQPPNPRWEKNEGKAPQPHTK